MISCMKCQEDNQKSAKIGNKGEGGAWTTLYRFVGKSFLWKGQHSPEE